MPVKAAIQTVQLPTVVDPNVPSDFTVTVVNVGDVAGEIGVILQNNGPDSIYVTYAGSEWQVASNGGAIEMNPDGGINIPANGTFVPSGSLRIPTSGTYLIVLQAAHWDPRAGVVLDGSPRTVSITAGISQVSPPSIPTVPVLPPSRPPLTTKLPVKGPLGLWSFPLINLLTPKTGVTSSKVWAYRYGIKIKTY